MERTYKFKIGQSVKMKDEDTGDWVKGQVTDTTSVSVYIKWEDLSEPTEHEQWEYESIRVL